MDCVTDNRNRAVAEIRHLLNRSGGNMAEAGALAGNSAGMHISLSQPACWAMTRHSNWPWMPAPKMSSRMAITSEIIGPGGVAFKKISDALKKTAGSARMTPNCV